MASGDNTWPVSAFSTVVARTGLGTHPPTAMSAPVPLPPLTLMTAATPMTAYRDAGCSNLAYSLPLALLAGRDVNARQHVLIAQGGGHHARAEISSIKSAAAARPGRRHPRAHGREHRWQIRSGIRVSHVATNRAAVSHGRIADTGCRVRERRTVLAERWRRGQFRMRRERTDSDRPVAHRNSLELGYPSDVNQRRRRREAELEQRDETMAPRKKLGARMLLQRSLASATEPAR